MSGARRTTTVWDVRVGERLTLASLGVTIVMVQKSGRLARLRVVAPQDVVIAHEASADQRASDDLAVPSMAT